MPIILSEPEMSVVKCDKCKSSIGYLPEDVKEYVTIDYTGSQDTYERVKCPRRKCKGYGYV